MKIMCLFVFLSCGLFSVDNSEIDLIKIAINDATVVFDVGAHSGAWTDACLNYNKESSYYLFEPSKYLFEKLSQKYKQNSNVSAFHFSLSDSEEELTLFNSGSPLGGVYFRPGCHNPDLTEIVPATTIDCFATKVGIVHINLLKIDTEGAELDILKGSAKLLDSQDIDVIQFEYGGTYLDANITLESVYNFLSAFGYRIIKMEGGNMAFIDEWNPALETYQYANYVALSPKFPLRERSN